MHARIGSLLIVQQPCKGMHRSSLFPCKPVVTDRVVVVALAGAGAAACMAAVGWAVHAAWRRARFRPLMVTLVPESESAPGPGRTVTTVEDAQRARQVVVYLQQWGVCARVSAGADHADDVNGTVLYRLPANQSAAAAAAYAALVLFAEAPTLPAGCARLLDLVPFVQQCPTTAAGAVSFPTWTPACPTQQGQEASWDVKGPSAGPSLTLSWSHAAGKVYDMTALAACKPFMQALVALCRHRLRALGATVLVAYSHTSSTLAGFVAQACDLRLVVVRKVTVGGPLDVPVPGPQETVNNSGSVEHTSTLQLWMEGLRGDDVPVLFEAVKNSGGVLSAMGNLVRRNCGTVHELVLIDCHYPDNPACSLLATPLFKGPWAHLLSGRMW